MVYCRNTYFFEMKNSNTLPELRAISQINFRICSSSFIPLKLSVFISKLYLKTNNSIIHCNTDGCNEKPLCGKNTRHCRFRKEEGAKNRSVQRRLIGFWLLVVPSTTGVFIISKPHDPLSIGDQLDEQFHQIL